MLCAQGLLWMMRRSVLRRMQMTAPSVGGVRMSSFRLLYYLNYTNNRPPTRTLRSQGEKHKFAFAKMNGGGSHIRADVIITSNPNTDLAVGRQTLFMHKNFPPTNFCATTTACVFLLSPSLCCRHTVYLVGGQQPMATQVWNYTQPCLKYRVTPHFVV